MDIKPVNRQWALVITALAILTMANAVINVSLLTTENESFFAYASAPITPDQNETSSAAPNHSGETALQNIVGVIKNIQCSEVCCYYTLSSPNNSKTIVLRGGSGRASSGGVHQKLDKGAVVKATWHMEKIYHPHSRIFKNERVIDSIEILR